MQRFNLNGSRDPRVVELLAITRGETVEHSKAWYVRRAIASARSVLHLTKTPKAEAAIEAAETWLRDRTETSGHAVAAAASAAAAAYAAAYAAYAAANATAYAAYAAAASAASAAAAVDAAYAAYYADASAVNAAAAGAQSKKG